MADAPRVFLSYSHDSDEHADRVLVLADALCDGGIEVILDRYVHPAPAEGWPRWMERNLDEAQFVLMVCTEIYRCRVMEVTTQQRYILFHRPTQDWAIIELFSLVPVMDLSQIAQAKSLGIADG